MTGSGSGRSGQRSHARRVAISFGYLNSGGAERAALNMAAAAPRSECIPVAEWRGGDLAASPDAAWVMFASNVCHRPSRIARVAALARLLRPVRPDVVVSMLSPVVSTAAARLADARVIHWLQAPWSMTTNVTERSSRARCERAILLGAIANSSLVACATPGLCAECRGLGIPERKLALLPNGLRPSFHVNGSASPRREARIVTIGRLERPKRHDLTLHALAAMSEPARLRVVGSGRDERELRRLAGELGLASRVDFVGYLEDPHVELASADVFVLATDYEGFGNVIVEALGHGLPVVVSDVPHGPRFILEDGHYGTLVEHGSVSSLARALDEAVSAGTRPPDAVSRAQKRAAAFSIEASAERFEELVDLVMSGARAVPLRLKQWP